MRLRAYRESFLSPSGNEGLALATRQGAAGLWAVPVK